MSSSTLHHIIHCSLSYFSPFIYFYFLSPLLLGGSFPFYISPPSIIALHLYALKHSQDTCPITTLQMVVEGAASYEIIILVSFPLNVADMVGVKHSMRGWEVYPSGNYLPHPLLLPQFLLFPGLCKILNTLFLFLRILHISLGQLLQTFSLV